MSVCESPVNGVFVRVADPRAGRRDERVLAARRVDHDGSDWLQVTVSDNGVGMTAEQCERVFDAFAQVPDAVPARLEGTGLGLTISRQLCQMMGGDINLSSQLGIGTEVSVRVPLIVEAAVTKS